ncbi:MAG TPA: ABC transporter permease, partial [Polyangiaceae bacterium]|nr:ABC transporter permease [Polyangiaceae bacterium]
ALPDQGLLVSQTLADILHLELGDWVQVKLRQGDFHTSQARVSALIDDSFGLNGYMTSAALNRLMRDDGAIDTALLAVDPDDVDTVQERLKQFPGVAKVASPRDFRRQFDKQSAGMMRLFTFIMTLFSSIIAIGVVYNNARVSLSQRTRDLASLRVIGFSKREISTILFGEQAVQVFIALPLGLVLGYYMSVGMMSGADPEAYRFPIRVSSRTYLYAMLVTLASAVVSALILRRKISNLDLIEVLKTRE